MHDDHTVPSDPDGDRTLPGGPVGHRDDDTAIGTEIGPYRLLRRIGAGGRSRR
jgi:hypothetical protein